MLFGGDTFLGHTYKYLGKHIGLLGRKEALLGIYEQIALKKRIILLIIVLVLLS